MKIKSGDYKTFEDFADAIVIQSLKNVLKNEATLKKMYNGLCDETVIDAAKVLLRYYS